MTLRPKQLVLATGMSGIPSMPEFPGMETFKGVQHHSSRHPGGDAFAGTKAVVIGSNNSAHDICADLYEHGADVTMVQRSSTHIVRSEPLMRHARIMHTFQIPVYQAIKEEDAEFYARLEKAGFMIDWGDDDSGLFMKYLRRGSGYYIDVGASELVAEGKIKLKSGVDVKEIKEHSVVLSDGSAFHVRCGQLFRDDALETATLGQFEGL